GFACCHGDDFDAYITRDHECERQPYAGPTVRQKAAVCGQIRQSDRRFTNANDECTAKNNESDYCDHFYHREPGLDRAEHFYVRGVDRQNEAGRTSDPDPGWNIGKPVDKIQANSRNLGSDYDSLRKPVAHAKAESGPAAQILLRVTSERTGNGVNAGHLGERVAHDHRDDGAKNVTDDDARACNANRGRASEKQTHTN